MEAAGVIPVSAFTFIFVKRQHILKDILNHLQMVRTIITPQQQNISILVPENYIGKQIEVLLYAVDELVGEERTTIPNNAARYKGIFSKEEGEQFNEYLNQARSEWDSVS